MSKTKIFVTFRTETRVSNDRSFKTWNQYGRERKWLVEKNTALVMSCLLQWINPFKTRCKFFEIFYWGDVDLKRIREVTRQVNESTIELMSWFRRFDWRFDHAWPTDRLTLCTNEATPRPALSGGYLIALFGVFFIMSLHFNILRY